MPKQPHHPHHHSASERAARQSGLQLPEAQVWVPGTPRWRYPSDWVKRPFWRFSSRGSLIFGMAWAAILLLVVVIAVTNR